MQVVRWAQVNEIPGKRIITPGNQYRYELTPELAEWMRIRRRKPIKGVRFGSIDAVLWPERSVRATPAKPICDEIADLLTEVEERVCEIIRPNPEPKRSELKELDQRLESALALLGTVKGLTSRFLSETCQSKSPSAG